jgi:antitoxin component YwqK of YwqJK toxin-antitoxin module
VTKPLITFFTVLFCLTSSVGWSETWDDLVKRDGIYFKKFTDVPFTGKMDHKGSIKNSKINLYEQGSIKNGKKDGSWVRYYDNGQLWTKGNYKKGKKEGSWFYYYDHGQLWTKKHYKNDKLEGSFVSYFNDGYIEIKGY